MTLTAKVLWPLFPLLLLVVVACLTGALALAARRKMDRATVRIQAGALLCYGVTAVTAIASEGGGLSSDVHRPFSMATQACMAWAIAHRWSRRRTSLRALNATALAAILADTALHYLLAR